MTIRFRPQDLGPQRNYLPLTAYLVVDNPNCTKSIPVICEPTHLPTFTIPDTKVLKSVWTGIHDYLYGELGLRKCTPHGFFMKAYNADIDTTHVDELYFVFEDPYGFIGEDTVTRMQHRIGGSLANCYGDIRFSMELRTGLDRLDLEGLVRTSPRSIRYTTSTDKSNKSGEYNDMNRPLGKLSK